MKRKGEVSHRAPCTFSFNTTLQRPTPEGCNLLSLERDSPPRFTERGRERKGCIKRRVGRKRDTQREGGKRGKKRKTTSKRQRSRDKPRDIYLTLKKSLAASNFPSHSADKHSPLLFFLLQLYRHTYLANYKIVNLDTL